MRRGLSALRRGVRGRCLWTGSHYAALSDGELAELVAARGLPAPPPGASRALLERLAQQPVGEAERERRILEEKEAEERIEEREGEEGEGAEATTQTVAVGGSRVALVGDRGFDCTVQGRFGLLGATASVDWADPYPMRGNIYTTVSETSEAWDMIPNTYRRRDAGIGDGALHLSADIQSIVSSTLLTDFVHPTRVHSHLIFAGDGSSPVAHIVASLQALRVKGVPVASVGGSRLGLSAEGDIVSDPDPRTSRTCSALLSVAVANDKIVWAEGEMRRVSTEAVQKLVKAATDEASQMAEELHQAVLPLRMVPLGAEATEMLSVPPDFSAGGLSENLLREVRLHAGPLCEAFAAGEWPGEAAAQSLILRCEERCHRAVRERASPRELRAAIKAVLMEKAALVRRATGMPRAKLDIIGSAVTVSHAQCDERAIAHVARQPVSAAVAPEGYSAPSLFHGAIVTAHGETDAGSAFFGGRARGANLASKARFLCSALCEGDSGSEVRVVLRGDETAAWDLALAAGLKSSDPIVMPSVAVWDSDSVTVRADPLQQAAAAGTVAVAADKNGRVAGLRVSGSGVSISQVELSVRAAIAHAAVEISRLPTVEGGDEDSVAAPLLIMPLTRGKRHRLASRAFLRSLASRAGCDLRLSSEGLEVRGQGDREKLAFETWDDCPSEGWVAEIDGKAQFGVFVTALDGDTPLIGLSGLVHHSRAGPGGSRMSRDALENDMPLKKRIKVRLIEWNADEKPMLERVE